MAAVYRGYYPLNKLGRGRGQKTEKKEGTFKDI